MLPPGQQLQLRSSRPIPFSVSYCKVLLQNLEASLIRKLLQDSQHLKRAYICRGTGVMPINEMFCMILSPKKFSAMKFTYIGSILQIQISFCFPSFWLKFPFQILEISLLYPATCHCSDSSQNGVVNLAQLFILQLKHSKWRRTPSPASPSHKHFFLKTLNVSLSLNILKFFRVGALD